MCLLQALCCSGHHTFPHRQSSGHAANPKRKGGVRPWLSCVFIISGSCPSVWWLLHARRSDLWRSIWSGWWLQLVKTPSKCRLPIVLIRDGTQSVWEKLKYERTVQHFFYVTSEYIHIYRLTTIYEHSCTSLPGRLSTST